MNEYVKSILSIHPDKNKPIYSEHDLNRKILWLLKDIKKTPLETLNSMWWSVQDDEELGGKMSDLIRSVRKKLGV